MGTFKHPPDVVGNPRPRSDVAPTRIRVLCRWVTAVTVFLRPIAAGTASAQASSAVEARQDEEARLLYQAGRRAFDDGLFDVALARFRESYDISHFPELLYNIGSAADRLRFDQQAIDAFSAYVTALPDAPNRRDVESRIATLRQATVGGQSPGSPSADARARAPSPEPTAPASRYAATTGGGVAQRDLAPEGEQGTSRPDSSTPSADPAERAVPSDDNSETSTERPEWSGWTALGGVVVAASGAAPAVLAGGTRTELEERCNPGLQCPAGFEVLRDRGISEALAADLMFALGGATAVGFGLVWLLVEEVPAAPLAANVSCNSDGCVATVRGIL